MGSERFPGKSMFNFKERASLGHLLDSLVHFFQKEKILVATSKLKANDSIRDFCKNESIETFSGDEQNVASRFVKILEADNSDYFVRLSGDSPLFDCETLVSSLESMKHGSPEILTSIYPERKMPSGINFEIVSRKLFLREYPNFSEERHVEHVTSYFYENAEKFNIKQAPGGMENPSKYKFSFDTQEDGKKIAAIFDCMDKPHWIYSLEEKCAIYERLFLSNA
jgi:spore coat polysaccharide biosynthesis protein SpsF